MRDAEDSRQSRGLFGERFTALEHHRLFPSPRQFVGGREPAYPRADDDDHARFTSAATEEEPAYGARLRDPIGHHKRRRVVGLCQPGDSQTAPGGAAE